VGSTDVAAAGSLAIVVCSRDRADRLRECLTAITATEADEVLVVDSASATGATSAVAAELGLRCIRVDEPGLARARNAAMRATTADIVAFTDDDCEPQPDWTATIRARITASIVAGEQVGFVTGRVVATGDGQPLSVLLGALPRTFHRDDDASHIGHGANLAIRRACWEALDGFDETLGVGGELRAAEDTDFLWRALRSGWIGHFEPHAVVAHDQWRGRFAALRTSYGYGVGAGAVRTKVRRLAGRKAARRFAAGSLRRTLHAAVTDARSGYEYGAVTNLVRIAGLVVGRTRAARFALDHGHLVPPGRAVGTARGRE
jgi:glycosyltransferase involved in cell wall biosynthesis